MKGKCDRYKKSFTHEQSFLILKSLKYLRILLGIVIVQGIRPAKSLWMVDQVGFLKH